MNPDLLPKRRLSEHVAKAIQDDLIQAKRSPGDQLPTEPELASQFGVSRTVIREAGRLLVDRGLVSIRPGRGMVVADYDGASLARQFELMLALEHAKFDDLIEMRLVLEVRMTEYAALRRTDADLIVMNESISAFGEPGLPHARALEHDLAFHAAVASAAKNPFFKAIVDPMNNYLRSQYRPSVGYEAARDETLAEHAAIADAIRRGSADEAGELAKVHLLRILEERDVLVPEESVDNDLLEHG